MVQSKLRKLHKLDLQMKGGTFNLHEWEIAQKIINLFSNS